MSTISVLHIFKKIQCCISTDPVVKVLEICVFITFGNDLDFIFSIHFLNFHQTELLNKDFSIMHGKYGPGLELIEFFFLTYALLPMWIGHAAFHFWSETNTFALELKESLFIKRYKATLIRMNSLWNCFYCSLPFWIISS